MAWDFRSKRRLILKQQNDLETIRDDMDQRFASLKALLELNEQLQKLPRDQYTLIQQQTVQNDISKSIKALTMTGVSLSDLFTRFGATLFKGQILEAQEKINEAEAKGRVHNVQLNLDVLSDRAYADMRADIKPESITDRFKRIAESYLPKNRQNEKYFQGIAALLQSELGKLRRSVSFMPPVEIREEEDVSEEQEDVSEEQSFKSAEEEKQNVEEEEESEQEEILMSVGEQSTGTETFIQKRTTTDPRNKKLAQPNTLFTSQDQPFKKLYIDIQRLGYDTKDFKDFYNQFVPSVFGMKIPEGHKRSKKPDYNDFKNFIQQPGTPFQTYLKEKDPSKIQQKDLLQYFIILNTEKSAEIKEGAQQPINFPGQKQSKMVIDKTKKYDILDFANVFSKSINDTEQELKKRSQAV